MKHAWLWWTKEDLRTERRQLADEGRRPERLQAELDRLLAEDRPEDAAFQEEANALLDKARLLPGDDDHPWKEPSSLEEIRALRPADAPAPAPLPDEAGKRSAIAGAWLGRCAGCLLGKPVEGIRRPRLRALLARAGREEITDYLWRLPGLGEEDWRAAGLANLPAWRATSGMPEDDDTNYTVMNMALVKAKGTDFTPADVAGFWMGAVPVLHTCTAERAAYRNFVNLVAPPLSAVVRNPYREWIGAQIRADFHGYVALGRPGLAAELAWRDASVSHVKNGIYGAMWVAAMLAAAPGERDTRRLLHVGLGEIPARSRLAEAVRTTLDWHAHGVPYAEAVERIHRRWDENQAHHWCHVIANAQVVAAALLYGEGDFERTVARAVLPCFDTDCNGATAGSIAGMMLGAGALPRKWTDILDDTLRTGIAGHHRCRISRLSEETLQMHLRLEADRQARP